MKSTFVLGVATSVAISMAIELPMLPEQFTVDVEANFLELNQTLSIREWFDHDNQWQRQEQRRGGQLTAVIDDYRVERRYTIADTDFDNQITYKDRCEVSPETYGPFTQDVTGPPRLESSTDFFRFGAQFNPQYLGQHFVRGIHAERWNTPVRNQSRSLPGGGRSVSDYDIQFSFAAEEWEAFSFRRGPGGAAGEHSSYRVPLRALVTGARVTYDTANEVTDVHSFQHNYEYVRFFPGPPATTLSRPPGATCNEVPARSFGPPVPGAPPAPSPSPEPTMPAFPTAYSASFDFTSEIYVDPTGSDAAADAPTGWVGSTTHVREYFDQERGLARMDVLAASGERVTLLEDVENKIRYRLVSSPPSDAAAGGSIVSEAQCQVFFVEGGAGGEDVLTDSTGHLRPAVELFGLHGNPGVDFNVTYKGKTTARGTVPVVQFDAQFERTGGSLNDGLFFETEGEEEQEMRAGEDEDDDAGTGGGGPPLGPQLNPNERFVCAEGVGSFFFVDEAWPVHRRRMPDGTMSAVPLEVQYRGRRRYCHEDGEPAAGAAGQWRDFRSDVSFSFFDPSPPSLESLTEHALDDVGLEDFTCDTRPYCATASVPDPDLCGADGSGGEVTPPSGQTDCPERTDAQLREEAGLAAGTFVIGLMFGGAFALTVFFLCCQGESSSRAQGAGGSRPSAGDAYSGEAMQPSGSTTGGGGGGGRGGAGAAAAPGFEPLDGPSVEMQEAGAEARAAESI